MNGTTTYPILYYTSPTQLAAILPSNTPVGTGQITVTTNGQPGPPASIQVVQSAFGLLLLNQARAAAALDANFKYLGLTNSVDPGEYVNFWGSGLGPASEDETNSPAPVNLANIPIEVDIGGIAATVTYHGRSTYPGLDQVQAIVPAGVQPGCNVSVVVRTGDIVSNFATIPIASSGRTCSEPALGITSDQLQSVLSNPSFTLEPSLLTKMSASLRPQPPAEPPLPAASPIEPARNSPESRRPNLAGFRSIRRKLHRLSWRLQFNAQRQWATRCRSGHQPPRTTGKCEA